MVLDKSTHQRNKLQRLEALMIISLKVISTTQGSILFELYSNHNLCVSLFGIWVDVFSKLVSGCTSVSNGLDDDCMLSYCFH